MDETSQLRVYFTLIERQVAKYGGMKTFDFRTTRMQFNWHIADMVGSLYGSLPWWKTTNEVVGFVTVYVDDQEFNCPSITDAQTMTRDELYDAVCSRISAATKGNWTFYDERGGLKMSFNGNGQTS